MRGLTFPGFLESYVRSLAGADTVALSKLVDLSASEPRLVEPMLLWAISTGRGERLFKLLDGQNALQQDLVVLTGLQEAEALASTLAAEDPRLRPEYSKVWRSYVVRRDARVRDAELKVQARKRVLALESTKRVTRYRMAKDLGLNPGNLHAFLSQGNPAKLSLDRVVELVEYLEAA